MSTAALFATASVLLAAFAAAAAPAIPGPPQTAAPPAGQVGPSIRDGVVFVRLTVTDGDQPPIEAGVWYPAQGATAPRPMIVISHGNGGDFRSHIDTARALAKAGFIVATLTHTGDNWRDQSRAADVAGRARQLSVLIDYILGQWDGRAGIDPQRIGAFGFSSGGFTVLAAAGGDPDLTRLADHCRAHPGFFDCRLVGRFAGAMSAIRVAPRLPHDTRLKALAIAAPALGFTFTREGLARVTQPVQLWQAGSDQILPSPFYAEPVRDALPRQPEYIRVDGAGHFDFLPPCSPELAAAAPMICTPTPGFDRAAFHERLNGELVRFFRANL
ncbi:putative dienelactone hydrolase [Caulobacter ginsengisoli]|uniref:Dienelactone hydrolase n=1 Tax=Caulobacter ginsengisoli TaxID=400775 RepID=A0ABU0IRR8_9CAUL|nr:dienelactone hydrolase [Caulobacter ginsengisoli]MDQ0464706.1 putative dienelactone hydrolase [Caulobacter ginsengisoli]